MTRGCFYYSISDIFGITYFVGCIIILKVLNNRFSFPSGSSWIDQIMLWQSTINNEAVILANWYKSNLLLKNEDKFYTIFLASRAKGTSETPVTIDDEEIEYTNSLRLLGSVIDRKINCGEHFSSEMRFKANSTIILWNLFLRRPCCVSLAL